MILLAYATLLRVEYPDLRTGLAVFALAAALGWLGAGLAAGHNLLELERQYK